MIVFWNNMLKQDKLAQTLQKNNLSHLDKYKVMFLTFLSDSPEFWGKDSIPRREIWGSKTELF